MRSPSNIRRLELTLSRLRTRQFTAVAGQTFLMYDYILTLPLEVDYIWNAPWRAVKIIFLLNRYGNLIGQSVFTLEEIGLLSHHSVKFCKAFPLFLAFFGVLAQESIHILVLLRAWAIWGCKYRVAVALISAYVFYLTASLGLLIYTLSIPTNEIFRFIFLKKTGVCISEGAARRSLQLLLPLISLSLDLVMFVMVAFTLGRLFRQTNGFQRSPVLRALAMDAGLFFATNALIGIISMLCQTLFVNDPRAILMIAYIPLITVAGQRVVLNLRRPALRAEARRNADEQITPMQPTSIWRSVEHWSTSHQFEPEQNRESGKVDNAFDLSVMEEPRGCP